MRVLATADWIVIVTYLTISMGVGLIWSKKAGESMTDFFLSGRTLPWWLAGVSMAATNFSIDTPLAITRYVAQQGIGGVWFFWSNAIGALLAVFLFSRLWRRAEVITDAELIELRYSGRSAAGLRLLKGLYFGVFINCYVLGWVLKAVIKVMSAVTSVDPLLVLAVAVVVALVYTLSAGLKGVVWTDFFQYGVGLVGSIVLAVFALDAVGGVHGLTEKLTAGYGDGAEVTRFVPHFGERADPDGAGPWIPLSVFGVYLLIQPWANKYSDGGGKHIQRMMACRTEGHAQGASMLFAGLNFAIQIWPWIITALCAMVLLPGLEDTEMGYPLLMAKLLPAGVLGLLVVTLLGAFMSTVDTHLNLGAAYLVNDIYKRFMRPDADERHYVLASRIAMLVILAAAILIALNIDSIGDAWKFILSFASGAGLTWILRWFWWRPNAWTEISAMLTSGVSATVLQLVYPDMPYTTKLPIIVAISTAVWVVVTYLTAPVDEDRLVAFVRRVRPGSPGWRRITTPHGITPTPFLGRGLTDAVIGAVCLFSFNFAVGNAIFARPGLAVGLALLGVAAGVLLIRRQKSAT